MNTQTDDESHTHCPGCGTHRDAIVGGVVKQPVGNGWTCERCVRRTRLVKQNPDDAKLVPVRCPVCRGNNTQVCCSTCSGYGAVRMPASALNVYAPATSPPRLLTEG